MALCMYLMVIIDNSSLFCLYIFVLEDLSFFPTAIYQDISNSNLLHKRGSVDSQRHITVREVESSTYCFMCIVHNKENILVSCLFDDQVSLLAAFASAANTNSLVPWL